jgi:hypothetical protein
VLAQQREQHDGVFLAGLFYALDRRDQRQRQRDLRPLVVERLLREKFELVLQ